MFWNSKMTAAMMIFDMPESCFMCPCFEVGENCGVCKLLDSNVAKNYVSNATYSRPENCPLKTIEIKVVDK